MKIGNQVRIKDTGKRYATYDEWAKHYGLRKFNDVEPCRVVAGEVGTVVAMGSHLDMSDSLVGIEMHGQHVIFDVRGLELVIPPNGVDGYSKPKNFTMVDLKVGQRAKDRSGRLWVAMTSVQSGYAGVVLSGDEGWIDRFEASDPDDDDTWDIMEVFEPPRYNSDLLKSTAKGVLVWKRLDATVAAKAAAEAEMAAARAAYIAACEAVSDAAAKLEALK